MVRVIEIRTTGDLVKADGVLARIQRRVPEMLSKEMMTWGKILERDMKESALAAQIKPFTGTLYSTGIQWRQRPRGRIGYLFVRDYGIKLDSMRPHWVNITARRTRLLAWAGQASDDLINNAATLIASGRMKRKAIFVRPHPFLRVGWNRARPKLRQRLKRAVQRGIAA